MRPLRTLKECVDSFGACPQCKLDALDLWLVERGDSSISVAVVGDARRCVVRVHSVEFEGVSEVAGRGGWWATWCAICAAVAAAETFERAPGANVG